MIGALRRWARSGPRKGRYSPVGVTFHWTVAALVLFQLWWGWRNARLPSGYEKLEAYEFHVGLGLSILVLTLLRMAWRLMVPGPINDADKPGWRSTAAHATHYAFYACLVGLPLSGWAMRSSTAREQPLTVAGLLPWPHLPFEALAPAQLWAIEAWAELVHFGFIITLLVLIPLHVGAALQHHFLHRHDVLKAMLPGLDRVERLIREAWRHRPRALRSQAP